MKDKVFVNLKTLDLALKKSIIINTKCLMLDIFEV